MVKDSSIFEITDLTNQKVVSSKAKIAANIWAQMKGLLGKNGLNDDEALIFPLGGSIHTFFMRFNIDIVFLDKDKSVLKIREKVKPWRLVTSPLRANMVIEFPSGTIAAKGIRVGNRLRIQLQGLPSHQSTKSPAF